MNSRARDVNKLGYLMDGFPFIVKPSRLSHCVFVHAKPNPASILRIHITNVLGLSANEQMIGADAKWIIAGMANHKPKRYITVRHYPSGTVGEQFLAPRGAFLESRECNPQRAVAVLSSSANPCPARRRLVDLGPETISESRACVH